MDDKIVEVDSDVISVELVEGRDVTLSVNVDKSVETSRRVVPDRTVDVSTINVVVTGCNDGCDVDKASDVLERLLIIVESKPVEKKVYLSDDC